MTVETVVGHNAAEIRVTDEENTEHIVDFTLIPVGTVIEGRDRWNWLGLVGVGLDAYPRVVANTEKIVYDLESLVAGRKVDSCNIGDGGEFSRGVVPR
jgi:hypothetical protein